MNKMKNNLIVVVTVAIGMNTGYAQNEEAIQKISIEKEVEVNGVMVKKNVPPKRLPDLVATAKVNILKDKELYIRGRCGARTIYYYIDGIRQDGVKPEETKIYTGCVPAQYYCPEGGVDVEDMNNRKSKNKSYAKASDHKKR